MYIIIVNEKAGNRNALTTWNELELELLQSKVAFTLLKSNSIEETTIFIEQELCSKKIQGVIAVGGDGTTSSVIQLLANTNIPIAIFPTGSGNDTARMFRLTHSPAQFVKSLLKKRITTIDLLKVNNRYGVTVAGVGIDSFIGNKVNHSFYKPILNKINLGSFTYSIAAISTLLTFKPFQATLTIDGQSETLENSWLIACGNTTSYGGGLTICPQALPTDGKMNLTLLHNAKRSYIIFKLFPILLRGKPIYKKGVTYSIAKKVELTTDRSIHAIVDGELFTTTPLTIEIQESALHLILTN